ncbi:hypothetical protein HNQ94_003536 [Salirhabdus euzebyi]|uniref:Purine nucleoside phosphorylase n=1 Tax=Salirhabdus euzebyi TaxID=394506 RepID=A0A841Q9Y1_9BACI|nr:peptidoglycan editing factor PgeF [Salirhabdus euzebyi]MBB6455042.1 hypothetical protein [Salirhabdus euzebyi]
MKDPFTKTKNSRFLQINNWKNANIIAGITTRLNGTSKEAFSSLNMGWHVDDNDAHVRNNYEIMEKEIKIPLNQWISSKQVHDTEIFHVKKDQSFFPLPNFGLECDGFVTSEKDRLLTAVFADCVPLFFAAPNYGWIGLAHAGWKGTVKGIGLSMIDKMVSVGIPLKDIQVVIGPCISADHYEVDMHVVDHIPEKFQRKGNVLTKTRENHYLLHLKALHKELFLDKGLQDNQVQMTTYCTFEQEELFYSHRRDNGHTGRMMAFIGMNSR